MRISDWSSDVCSSDLARRQDHRGRARQRRAGGRMRGPGPRRADRLPGAEPACGDPGGAGALAGSARTCAFAGAAEAASFRSEEHTSELQSLMRISYAVFCLKKKNNTHIKIAPITRPESRKTMSHTS